MFTQCPDCSTTFRVTADVLKQAVGKVRCGACGNAFNALEFLSENKPEQPPTAAADSPLPELTPDSQQTESGIRRVSPEQRARLQQTLEQLAGSDVRIEDTGAEWRVLYEDLGGDSELAELFDESSTPVDEFLAHAPTTVEAGEIFESPSNPFSETIVDELRFDDDTPLPDDLAPGEIDVPGSPDAGEQSTAAAGPEASPTENGSSDEPTGEQDDWADILGEFDEPIEAAALPLDAELAAAEHADNQAAAAEETDGASAYATHDDGSEEHSIGTDPGDNAAPLEFGSIAIGAPDGATSPDQTGAADDDDEFWNSPAMFAGGTQQLVDDVDAAPGFESIVMEGEVVRAELDKEKLAADRAAATELAERMQVAWDAENAEPPFGKPRGMQAAVIALFVLLLVQVVHQSRDALATVPAFDSIISPVYQAIGMPLWPAWDVTAWRFEATRGIADENNEQLTIRSRIGNTSGRPAPLPLLGVTLTDRFEEPVASRVVEPREYLTGDFDLQQPVEPGNTFQATISIKSPPEQATGFKLRVCYALSDRQLRCAIDSFK